MNDQEFVDLLEQVWGSIAGFGADLSESEWKTMTEVPGWSVQDNLTHITALEWSLLGRAPVEHELPDALPHIKNDVGRSNEVFVDSRRTLDGASALAEFVEVTGERVAQLRACGPGDFAKASWTPAGEGTVRDLLPFRIFDSWVHEQDMRRAVGRSGGLDTPVAEVGLERVVSVMPFVVGKKAAAPEGTTVVFALSGPLAQTVAIGVEGGRAKRLTDIPSAPTATIATDTETFARVGTGRVTPEVALGDGSVELSGDVDLAGRVVENLNFLF